MEQTGTKGDKNQNNLNKGENYYRGAGTKGDKYHDGDRKMDAI